MRRLQDDMNIKFLILCFWGRYQKQVFPQKYFRIKVPDDNLLFHYIPIYFGFFPENAGHFLYELLDLFIRIVKAIEKLFDTPNHCR